MKLALCVATMRNDPIPGDVPGWLSNSTTNVIPYIHHNTPENNLGVVKSYDKMYRESTEDILFYVHDDVICGERGWDERLLAEFQDPAVGVVGFGGAKWHGAPELYKAPYVLQQLRRGDYLSNVDDAEVHGERFRGETDVAVLDGFALAVRRSLLDRYGSWSAFCGECDFFCYDYALCAIARRIGYRVRVVGIRCHHRGGQTSVAQKDAVRDIISQAAYDKSHRWFYDNFRDVMPWRCS